MMKSLLDLFKAVGVVILVIAVLIAGPIIGVIIAVIFGLAFTYLIIQDHRKDTEHLRTTPPKTDSTNPRGK